MFLNNFSCVLSSTHQVLEPCWAVYEERDWVTLSWQVSGLLPADTSYWNKGSVNIDLGKNFSVCNMLKRNLQIQTASCK